MTRAVRVWRCGLAAGALSFYPGAATAQFPEPSESRTVAVTAAFGCNVLLGGLTAAARALIQGHDPARAFAIGAIGGAVHFSAKLIGPGSSLAGVALGATGTAIVVNAGRGAGALDELYLPIGPMRVRITPRSPAKVRLAVNAFNTAVLARSLMWRGLVVDWGRSASTGTVAFRTDGRRIVFDDREAHGLAMGPFIVISAFATHPAGTTKHELVHAHQYWFMDEALGRPAEEYLRARIPGIRRLPAWLELGVLPPTLSMAERGLVGREGPVFRIKESEAEILARP